MRLRRTTHEEQREDERLELGPAAEQELRALFRPLAQREASPELNLRLREGLRQVRQELRREQHAGLLRRLWHRRVTLPLPLVLLVALALAVMACWIAILESAGPPQRVQPAPALVIPAAAVGAAAIGSSGAPAAGQQKSERALQSANEHRHVP